MVNIFLLIFFSFTQPNIVIGLALFYGGMVQFAAGMWEFVSTLFFHTLLL